MKRLLLLMTCACFSIVTITKADNGIVTPEHHSVVTDDWAKAKNGVWEGMKDNKTYWYKIDKSAKLWWSTDGKKWAAVEDGMWADKDGKWLKIGDGKLWWSADQGANWAEVPEWKWEGPKGEWYKFDQDWTLWVSKK
ncbi:hypothetical protein [Chitinophaga rhizophila]|uniref:WWE domain-containing protein n=1 Tax=Chitinophaga rhizophila TaxID=2866212 RepID=A0ABS7GBS7_9BACT|nr:hypothetical protein [Chitinophaga rhizophila]MBW8685132.1 hypothetical protein [Chitinophaga rhizophila]